MNILEMRNFGQLNNQGISNREKRGRIKLSTELFESSKLIQSAGKELEKVYN